MAECNVSRGAVMHLLESGLLRLIESFGVSLRAHRMDGSILRFALAAACALVVACGPALAQGPFRQELIQAGAKMFAQRCAICHGQKMQNPDTDLGAFDLREFPRDEHDRFVHSVTNGKNAMPAWGALISPADIEALWAYICAGEK